MEEEIINYTDKYLPGSDDLRQLYVRLSELSSYLRQMDDLNKDFDKTKPEEGVEKRYIAIAGSIFNFLSVEAYENPANIATDYSLTLAGMVIDTGLSLIENSNLKEESRRNFTQDIELAWKIYKQRVDLFTPVAESIQTKLEKELDLALEIGEKVNFENALQRYIGFSAAYSVILGEEGIGALEKQYKEQFRQRRAEPTSRIIRPEPEYLVGFSKH